MQAHLFKVDTVMLTRRTLVRRFRENDGPTVYELFQNNHQRLSDHFPFTLREVSSPEAAEVFVRHKLSAWLLQSEYAFGVWDSDEAKLIGYAAFFNLDWRIPEGRLTFFIDENYGRRGIMTEVVAHLTQYAFEQLKLERVYMLTAQDNYAAQRLLRKCGYRREGDLRNAFRRPTGGLLDMMLFAYTREENEKV